MTGEPAWLRQEFRGRLVGQAHFFRYPPGDWADPICGRVALRREWCGLADEKDKKCKWCLRGIKLMEKIKQHASEEQGSAQ